MMDTDLVLSALSKALRSVIAALILFGTIHWTGEQTAGAVLAFEAVVSVPLLVWRRNAKPAQ